MKNLQIADVFPLKKPVIKQIHQGNAPVGKLNPFRPDDG